MQTECAAIVNVCASVLFFYQGEIYLILDCNTQSFLCVQMAGSTYSNLFTSFFARSLFCTGHTLILRQKIQSFKCYLKESIILVSPMMLTLQSFIK